MIHSHNEILHTMRINDLPFHTTAWMNLTHNTEQKKSDSKDVIVIMFRKHYDWMLVGHNIHMLKPQLLMCWYLDVGPLGGRVWEGHEGGTSMITVLVRRGDTRTHSFCHAGHSKRSAICMPQKSLYQNLTTLVPYPALRLPVPRNVRKQISAV